jgi:hypothetical protein
MNRFIPRISQALWVVLAVVCIGMTIAGVPAYFHQLSHPPAAVPRDLHRFGVSVGVYAVYMTALTVVADLIGLALAGAIAWRRFNEAIGLVTSLFLALLVAGSPTNSTPVAQVYPALAGPANVLGFLFLLFMVVFVMTFPNGRVVPRRATGPFWVGIALYAGLFVVTGQFAVAPQDSWVAVPLLFGLLVGLCAQIYRFVRVSDPLERQQTKLVLLALAVAILASIPFAFFPLPSIGPNQTPYDAVSVTVLVLAFLLIPISIGVAMLRYRLWDVDLLINRALVYGSLTASLAGLYAIGVIAFQSLARALTGQTSDVGVAVVTLAVAALFNPWRRRLQAFIDRRFYRHKYDAGRILSSFTTRLRDEVDLDQLSGELVIVLQQTVQPTSVSLWLKRAEGEPA